MAVSAILQTQLVTLQAQIGEYNAAITALLTDGIQSYQLNTGQTDQKVTKLDLAVLQKTVESLLNQCVTLEARLGGGGVLNLRPAW